MRAGASSAAPAAGRQRAGQDRSTGLPVAADAGRGHVRDDRRAGQRERVNRFYLSRVLRLTLLAPDIVEAILDGRQPTELQLDNLLDGFPLEWKGQQALLLRVVRPQRFESV